MASLAVPGLRLERKPISEIDLITYMYLDGRHVDGRTTYDLIESDKISLIDYSNCEESEESALQQGCRIGC